MYESHFHLSARPFEAAPRADRFFAAASIDAARQSLVRCIERAEGVGLLIGPSGTGKTLLAQVLAEQFREQFSVALLSNGHLASRRALLQAILFELGLPYHGLDEGELRLALVDFVSTQDHSPGGLLLIIDEAHLLGMRLLEELRMITNLVRDGQPRVRLVLVGAMALEERLASPRLESFVQRIRSRCYLGPLDKHETAAYVRSQIGALGGDADALFTLDALDNLYAATTGIPRLVNQVCDHALLLALAGNRSTIDGAGIEEAWADLQQLPMPTQQVVKRPAPIVTEEQDSVIEYGSLEEDGIIEINTPKALPAPQDIVVEPIAGQLKDEFQPQAPLGPEVELIFSGALDPFAERFDEEEPVADRYAGVDAAIRTAKPVYSAEGLQLSAMLDPFLQASPEALELADEIADLPPAREPIAPPLRPDAGDAEHHAAHEVHDLNPADDPVMPESSWETPTRTIYRQAVAPQQQVRPDVIDELEMIIIEDDPAPASNETLRGPTARRQEYGKLFVKLRGG